MPNLAVVGLEWSEIVHRSMSFDTLLYTEDLQIWKHHKEFTMLITAAILVTPLPQNVFSIISLQPNEVK